MVSTVRVRRITSLSGWASLASLAALLMWSLLGWRPTQLLRPTSLPDVRADGSAVRLDPTLRSEPFPPPSGGRGCPRRIGSGTELAEGRSADEMSLGVEGVVDAGMGGEETLG